MAMAIGQRALRYGGFTLYFAAAFLLFCYLAFPYDHLARWLQQRVRVATAPNSMELQIGTLSPSWFTGVALSDVRLSQPGTTPRNIEFDELLLRVSPLSLLFGNLSLSFDGESGLGSLEGEFTRGEDIGTELQAELSDLDITTVGLGHVGGLPVTGMATGTVDLKLPPPVKEWAGDVDLQIARVTLGDGEAKLKVPGLSAGFTLEKLDAGRLDLDIEIADAVAKLDKVHSKGKDLEFDASGSLRLAERFASSRLDVVLEATFSEAYKRRDEKTRALFDLLGFQRQIKQATTDDGGLRFRLGGTVAMPRATPAGKASPAATARRVK